MESDVQQPTDDASNSLEVTTALEPEARRQISPTTQSIEKGQWIVAQIFDFIVGLPDYVGTFFNRYKQLIISIAVIWGAAIAIKVVLAIMDALNDIPLLAPIFESIGVGYCVWFINRYLLKPPTRQELAQKLEGVLKQD